MKRASKTALIISGTAFVAGAAVGIVPFLGPLVDRLSSRNEVLEGSMMGSDFYALSPGGAPRPMNAVSFRNSDNASGLSSSSVSIALTEPADPEPDAVQFSVTDLNSLPGGKGFEPMAINNQGEIVGNYRSVEPVEYTVRAMDGRRMASRYRATSRPAVFRGGKFEDLTPAPDCIWTFATGINDQGVVVGAARPLRDTIPPRLSGEDLPLLRVLRWERGACEDISKDFYRVPDMERDVRASRFTVYTGDPVFINNDGTIFLGTRNLYRWRQGTVTRFEIGLIRQINEQGIMVGLVPSPKHITAPDVTMPPGMPATLGGASLQPGILNTETGQTTALGRFSDMPCAINDSGLVVLSGNRAGNVSQLSTWKSGKAEKFASVPATINCYINNHGWVAMGEGIRDWPRDQRGINPLFGPFLWTGKQFYSLQSLIADLKGEWAFSYVMGMNDRNQILVYAFGVGSPKRHAFLLTPKNTNRISVAHAK